MLVGHKDPHSQGPHSLVRKTRQQSKIPDREQTLNVRASQEDRVILLFVFLSKCKGPGTFIHVNWYLGGSRLRARAVESGPSPTHRCVCASVSPSGHGIMIPTSQLSGGLTAPISLPSVTNGVHCTKVGQRGRGGLEMAKPG